MGTAINLVVRSLLFLTLGHSSLAAMNNYLSPTLHSMDCMRASTGLVADSAMVLPYTNGESATAIWANPPLARSILGAPPAVSSNLTNREPAHSTCPLIWVNQQTSPTNIALDLILLLEQQRWQDVDLLLTTIERLPYHFSTGLFFNRYDMNHSERVSDFYVSSVDNVHLVLALWVLSEINIESHSLSQRARQLSQRFDWTELVDAKTGLVRGGLSYDGEKFQPAPWYFSHAGSEARSIYSVGYAIGFLKTKIPAQNLTWEFHRDSQFGLMMRTWDGGVFQMLLPEILIRESHYSAKLKSYFENFSRYALFQSGGAPLPLLHSACQLGPFNQRSLQNNDCGVDQPCYLGKSGHLELVSHHNQDRLNPSARNLWERVSTLHAIFLASVFEPLLYAQRLQEAERLTSGGTALFHSQLGWMDSYHVSGPYKNKVVPMLLSLDQGMAALAMLRTRAADHHNIVSRTLAQNPKVAHRLREIYSDWERDWPE